MELGGSVWSWRGVTAEGKDEWREGGRAYLNGEGILDKEDARGHLVLLDLVLAARRQLLLDVGLDLGVGACEGRGSGEGGWK